MSEEFEKRVECVFTGWTDQDLTLPIPKIGLLFSGNEVIAKFRSITNEDGGKRWLSDFWDLTGEEAGRLRDMVYSKSSLLRVVYVEYNPEAGEGAPGRLIEDFGFQYIQSIAIQLRWDKPELEMQLSVIKKRTPKK